MLSILVSRETGSYQVQMIDNEAPEQKRDDQAQEYHPHKQLIFLLEIAEDDEPVSFISFPFWVLKLDFHKFIAFYYRHEDLPASPGTISANNCMQKDKAQKVAEIV